MQPEGGFQTGGVWEVHHPPRAAMSTRRYLLLIAAGSALIAVGGAGRLFADDAATVNLLCAAPWEVTGTFQPPPPPTPPPGAATPMPGQGVPQIVHRPPVPWTRVRTFNKDGTFSTEGVDIESGTWVMDKGRILLVFANHKDTITLPLNPQGTFGTDSQGDPTYLVQLPPLALPASPELIKKAGDLAGACAQDMVLATGTNGAGLGFIAVLGKSNFLITNAHFVAVAGNISFTTLDKQPVKGGSAYIAVARDAFCMMIPAGGRPLEMLDDLEKNAAVGDDVVVLASPEGEGVVKPLTGQIRYIGNERVELNAPYAAGCSGGPVIHVKTGKVIGIAAWAQSNDDELTKMHYVLPFVHRYAIRIDNVKGWENVAWPAFYAQVAEMEKIAMVTADIAQFLKWSELENDEISRSYGFPGDVLSSPAMKVCYDRWKRDYDGAFNAEDKKMAAKNFIYAIKIASQADVTAARQHITYNYFVRELADAQKARDEMTKPLEKLIAKFTK